MLPESYPRIIMQARTRTIPVRFIAGMILLLAALAKSWFPAPNRGSAIYLLVACEFTLAAWLLSGWQPVLATVIASFAFGLFTLLSIATWWRAAPPCSCFGAVEVRPSAMLILNVATLGALVLDLRSRSQSTCLHRIRTFIAPTLLVIILVSASFALADNMQPANDEWVQRCIEALKQEPGLPASYSAFLVQTDCNHCRELLRNLHTIPLHERSELVVIETTPFATNALRKALFPAGVRFLQIERISAPCLPAQIGVTDGKIARAGCVTDSTLISRRRSHAQ